MRIETDEGLAGFGETCPLGPAYLPAHAEGARAALREVAPSLLGLDPRNLNAVNDTMDAALAVTATPRPRSTSPAGTCSARPRGCR